MASEEIDFSDLEAEFAVSDSHSLNSFVVVDGAPIAPAAKVEALTKVLKKVLTKVGGLKGDNGFYMPTDENGATLGYAFLEYESEQAAKDSVKAFNGKKLDSKHVLLVDRLSNVTRLLKEDVKNAEDAAKEAKERVGEFKPLPHLRSWLADPQGRDQAVFHVDDSISLNWIRKDVNPREVVRRHNMTDTYARWSPQGSYLLGLFNRGCMLYGGPELDVLGRLPHPGVRFVDFSPDERFLVTASDMPLPAVPEKAEARNQWPFKESDEGNQIVVWDLKTLAPLRTFPQQARPATKSDEPPARLGKSAVLAQLVGMEDGKSVWPALKWSSDSNYFARITGPDTLAVYESATMALVGKKTLKINGLQDISFAPAAVNGKQLLAYWVPEVGSQTARMAILDVPSMQVVRNRSLFNVSNVRFYWQNEAKYLAVKVDRLNKNKKTAFSSLELYRLQEKGIPVDVTELKELVTDLSWEPKNSKMVVLSQLDVNGQNLSSSKTIVSFYALERNKGLEGGWKEAYRFESRPANLILWSPAGRFVVTGVIKGPTAKPSIEFWDTEQEGQKNQTSLTAAGKDADLPINLCSLEKREDGKFGMTDAAWDSSGGVLATWSSQWRNGGNLGYRLWNITGRTLRDERIDKFKSFMWRPRPASLLTAEKRAEIAKNLKAYAAEFDAEDAVASLQESDELQRKLDSAIHSWISFRGRTAALLGERKQVSLENTVRLVDGRPRVFEISLVSQKQEVAN